MPRYAPAAFDLESLHYQELDDAALILFFRRQLGSDAIDDWLLSPLRRGTLAGQRFLRLARHAAAVSPASEGESRVLFGVPIACLGGEGTWGDAAGAALEAGLSYAWERQVRVCSRPIPVRLLHRRRLAAVRLWSAELLNSLPGTPDSVGEQDVAPQAEPYVWVGATEMPEPQCEALFYRNTSEAAALVRPLAMRIDALLEESGLRVRMLPPTGFWNAMSFARLAQARWALKERRDLEGAQVAFYEGQLRALRDGNVLWSQDFPEEVLHDVRGLLRPSTR